MKEGTPAPSGPRLPVAVDEARFCNLGDVQRQRQRHDVAREAIADRARLRGRRCCGLEALPPRW